MIAFLDNIPVQGMSDTLLNPVFTLRKKDDNGDSVVGFSGDVTFIETEYNYLYAQLKTSPNAKTNKVTLKFVDDCCTPQKEYEFTITHESLRWCDERCELTCTPVEKSLTNDQLICLKNTLIWDDWNGFKSIQHPRMAYCNELRPNWMHRVILLLSVNLGFLLAVLSPILLVIGIIITIINAFVNALNALIPGDGPFSPIDFDNDPSTNVFQEMAIGFNRLMSFVVGCGRKHPSPLVRDYADNVCGKCGISFQSTIFKNNSSSYNNTVFVNAPINKGTLITDNTTYWIDENKPLLNGTKFFDLLKPVFNAEWRVKNNTLRFERRDNFQQLTPFLNLTTLNQSEIDVCWTWQKKQAFSYATFAYFKDAVNWIGSEAVERWGDIIEWNSPYTTLQKGEYAPLVQFSACRFRDDGIDDDILTEFKYYPFVGPIIQQAENAMIMNSHNCYMPMLLIWDPTSGVANAKCDNISWFFPGYYTEAGRPVNLNQFYNYPLWFNEGAPGNLYTNFHFIEDPRTSTFKGLNFTASVPMTCALKAVVDIDGSILTSEGLSRELTEININHKTGIITFTGTV